ncbi:unnamed protein product, partial [Schistosoma turkestanicum]
TGIFTFIPYISGVDESDSISISAALLHPPFLYASESKSEKYGILGSLIGRQLISG